MVVKAAASPILHLIRRTVEDHRLRELPDQELLQRFHAHQDQAAFHALLRRHGPIVLDVCRGVLGHEADAEDAFQATFLILVQKAGSIRKTASLGSWLHGVAYRTALKARAQSAMRQKHEARVPARTASEPDDMSWREVRQVLHEELRRLPLCYRAPLVLCYLQGATQDAAAVALSLAKSTLRQRLERGRELLRTRLMARGLGPVAVLVATAWPSANTAAWLPGTLVSGTTKAAGLFAAGQAAATGAIPVKVAALTEGVLKSMLLTKLKIATAVVLVTALACSGIALLSNTRAGAARAELCQIAQGEGKAGAPKKESPKENAAKEEQKKEAAVEQDMGKLEGTWVAESTVIAGTESGPNETTTLVIKYGALSWIREAPFGDGKAIGTIQFTFRINPAKEPAEMDLVPTEGALKGEVFPSIYLIDGDTLKICRSQPGAKRPTKFASEKGDDHWLLVLKRQKPDQEAPREGKADVPKKDNPKEGKAKEEQRKEATKLNGKWKAVAAEISGNVLPEDTAQTNVWDIADGKITRKLPKNKVKGGTDEEVLPFKTDPNKKPAHIDIEGEVAGQKIIIKGIYKLDGDELTVCLYGADGGRPAEFTSSDLGNGQKGGNFLLKFRREKQDTEKQEKK
jgi:RNA polymerase sigma factor (sigma-70 family)